MIHLNTTDLETTDAHQNVPSDAAPMATVGPCIVSGVNISAADIELLARLSSQYEDWKHRFKYLFEDLLTTTVEWKVSDDLFVTLFDLTFGDKGCCPASTYELFFNLDHDDFHGIDRRGFQFTHVPFSDQIIINDARPDSQLPSLEEDDDGAVTWSEKSIKAELTP